MSTPIRLVLVLVFIASGSAWAGPGPDREPPLRALAEGVEIATILSAGDAVSDREPEDPSAEDWPVYRFAGRPHGLAVRDRGDGTFTLLVCHDIPSWAGIPRAHGMPGSFVSRWRIRASDRRILDGKDLVRRLIVPGAKGPLPPAKPTPYQFRDIGSLELVPASALFHDDGVGRTVGTRSSILVGGEQWQNGRAWAHSLTGPTAGTSVRLDSFGCSAPVHVRVCPVKSPTTLAVALDHSGGVPRTRIGPHGPSYPSEIYVYTGAKRRTGTPVERAGLVGGVLRGVRLEGCRSEHGNLVRARFDLVAVGNGGEVVGLGAIPLQNQVIAAGTMHWNRPGGGAWDPAEPADFWFTTSGDKRSRRGSLWRLRFDDLEHPERGGVVERVLRGSDCDVVMPSDVTVLADGTLVFVESPGRTARCARMWMLRPGDEKPTAVAEVRRMHAAANPHSREWVAEDLRGVVDASSVLGAGWVLVSVQIRKPTGDVELVEDGHVVALRLPKR
jgi:hypothetical protein